jgi:centrosomal protein CEP41
MAFAPLKARKPLNPLDKKIPINPRYANVGPVIDTGAKMKSEVPVSDKYIARRKGEMFKRIGAGALAALLNKEDLSENIYQPSSSSSSPVVTITEPDQQSPTEPPEVFIMDVRSEEDYAQCHIKSSVHYPIQKVHRDEISVTLYKLKRKQAGKHLIVYHSDDKNSMPAAMAMVEKGWEEVLMLSGGIEEFAKKFPGLVDGVLINPSRPSSSSRPRSSASIRK